MSPASLRLPSSQHPDSTRIAAYAAAITLNLVALMFALRPAVPQFLGAVHHAVPTTISLFEKPKPLPPPPPIHLERLPPKAPPTPHHVVVVPPAPPVVVPTEEGRAPAPPVVTAPTIQAPPETAAPAPVATGLVSLAYRAAPLHFPPQALRQHIQGKVLLRVLVDEQGKPLQVEVAHSSGYQLLDRSARDQVLASWLFQPAMAQGKPVKAWAQVPVQFDLQDL